VRTTYLTATTINGFLATPDNSLDWLFAVEGDHPDYEPFFAGVTVLVVGATTYEWVLAQESIVENPAKWQEFYGDRPTYVFSHRELPIPAGADVRIVGGAVGDVPGGHR
jgi:dihydrofolate reductase